MTKIDNESVARAYIDAVGRGDLASLHDLLDDALVARFVGVDYDKSQWLAALARLLPALIRNDVREVFVAGERACVIYDFVTDTPAGAIECVELVTVVDGRITHVELLLDRVAFGPVNAALEERAVAR